MILRLDKIDKSFGERKILNNISYDFNEGQIYLIKGESGSGKTTFLEICAGLQKSDNGKVILNDDIDVGFVFQEFSVFENLSVYDNLYVDLLLTTNYSKEAIQEKIDSITKKIGLHDKLGQKAKLLSGGERQRLSLARAILKNNSVILADEPSANIDEKNVEIVKEIFLKLKKKGALIIIATHDNVFDEIADASLYLKGGVIRCA